MEADDKIKKPDKQHPVTPPTTTPAKVEKATDGARESSHDDSAPERFWLWRSNTQVIFALAFNAGVLLLMFFQSRAMNRQLKIMADQFESQQRSWTGVKYVELSENAQPGKPLRFTITIENSGHSPALRVIGHHHFRKAYPTLADINQESDNQSVNAMAPGSVNEYSVSAKGPISSEMLKDRSLALYVFGKLTYEDSFGKHLTTYCGIWKPEFGRRVSSCPDWNDMR